MWRRDWGITPRMDNPTSQIPIRFLISALSAVREFRLSPQIIFRVPHPCYHFCMHVRTGGHSLACLHWGQGSAPSGSESQKMIGNPLLQSPVVTSTPRSASVLVVPGSQLHANSSTVKPRHPPSFAVDMSVDVESEL